MRFLLPSEHFNVKNPNSDFRKEYDALIKMDFEVFLYDHEQFIDHKQIISNIDFSYSGDLILRTYPLNGYQYKEIYNILNRNGIVLINNPEQYLNCHYYPNLYYNIKEFAPKSIWTNDMSITSIILCREHINSNLVIKDYVKSEKNLSDIFILEKSLSNDDFFEKINKFKSCRGRYFNEGIVFKEFLELKKYGDKTNEFKINILNGKIISHSKKFDIDSKLPDITFIRNIMPSIDSNYYSIYIAEKLNGDWVILKFDDGQVSKLLNDESEHIYYSNFLEKS